MWISLSLSDVLLSSSSLVAESARFKYSEMEKFDEASNAERRCSSCAAVVVEDEILLIIPLLVVRRDDGVVVAVGWELMVVYYVCFFVDLFGPFLSTVLLGNPSTSCVYRCLCTRNDSTIGFSVAKMN